MVQQLKNGTGSLLSNELSKEIELYNLIYFINYSFVQF